LIWKPRPCSGASDIVHPVFFAADIGPHKGSCGEDCFSRQNRLVPSLLSQSAGLARLRPLPPSNSLRPLQKDFGFYSKNQIHKRTISLNPSGGRLMALWGSGPDTNHYGLGRLGNRRPQKISMEIAST